MTSPAGYRRLLLSTCTFWTGILGLTRLTLTNMGKVGLICVQSGRTGIFCLVVRIVPSWAIITWRTRRIRL